MTLNEQITQLNQLADEIITNGNQFFIKARFKHWDSSGEPNYHLEGFDESVRDIGGTLSAKYHQWFAIANAIIERFLPNQLQRFLDCYDGHQIKAFGPDYNEGIKNMLRGTSLHYSGNPSDLLELFVDKFNIQKGILDAARIRFELDLKFEGLSVTSPIPLLLHIFSRFKNVARQLVARRENGGNPRSTLKINDEYDVQDLLHVLLVIFFEDIRPEEWTPSYAGGASRMDFLLKREKIVIEVKYASPKLGAKEVGKQLIEDIQKYQKHPDCKTLLCFVYDPNGSIDNPRGLESDLYQNEGDFLVQVCV